MHTCEVCSAKVSELRRGRCWGCYARWVDARPVGSGARCITCSEKRHKVLRAVELFGGWQAMCFNCAGQLLHIAPLPDTLAELREAISRERRRSDRRDGRQDTRVFRYERRVGSRRLSVALGAGLESSAAGEKRGWIEEYPIVEDDMVIEVTFADEDVDVGFECDDLTSIRPLLTDLDAARA